jgi:glutamate-1-semialdehyde 2,1-aminomutase
MAAGCAALDALRAPGVYERLAALTTRLTDGLASVAKAASVDVTINRVASMFTMFFCRGPVTDYASAKASDTARFARFFHGMLRRGVYLPPAQFEAAFVGLAHTEADVDNTLRAAREALEK